MSVRSDRRERAKGFALAHRALNAHHHDAAGALGADDGGAEAVQRVHAAENLTVADAVADFGGGHEEPVVRGRVMNLEMGFVGVARGAQRLLAQFYGALGGENFERGEQMAQAAMQMAEVTRVDVAGAAAFDVDRGNVARMCGAQRPAGEKRTGPTPEGVEARGHGALRAVDGFFVGDETRPRQQFVGAAGAVQIDVVRDLPEELGVEEVGEALSDRAAGVAGKGAGEIHLVDGIRAEAGVERALVQHGHHDNGAAESFRAPVLGPVAEQRGTLVFVAVGGAVEQKHGTGLSAAPDPSIEADATGQIAVLVKAGRESLKIDGKFGSGGTHG
jgi:hypothetical protein